jgi:hypothetical protein
MSRLFAGDARGDAACAQSLANASFLVAFALPNGTALEPDGGTLVPPVSRCSTGPDLSACAYRSGASL